MKRLLFAILFCLIGSLGYAQDYAAQVGSTVTHTNAQADTISFAITKSRTAITIKYDIAKTSGTVAGTIVLQGKITAAGSTEQWTTLNSYTLTDATATNSVALTANQYVNYRIITTTSGTSVSVHKKWLLYRGY
jgi:hypothetical protein